MSSLYSKTKVPPHCHLVHSRDLQFLPFGFLSYNGLNNRCFIFPWQCPMWIMLVGFELGKILTMIIKCLPICSIYFNNYVLFGKSSQLIMNSLKLHEIEIFFKIDKSLPIAISFPQQCLNFHLYFLLHMVSLDSLPQKFKKFHVYLFQFFKCQN